MSPATDARTVHIEHCMGTVFSIDLRDGGDWSSAIEEVVSGLHHVDRIFSTYQENSPVSRLGRGEITLAECPAEVAHVLGECEALASLADGYFSAYPTGLLDPSGYVKGWAVERASQVLRKHGSHNHAVNGGGDIQCAGESAPGQPWRVGLAHPLKSGELAGVVALRDGAVATSGTAERGTHIVNPKTGKPAVALASVSVIGTRLSIVDAYATAAFAMGIDSKQWLSDVGGCEALVISAEGRRWQSPGFPSR